MEKNDEIKGEGNSYTATFWEYDPRIGRRWNLDPVVKNWQSSYSTFSDNPVNRIDPNGDDDYFNTKGQILKRTNTKTSNIYVQTAEGVKLLSELNLKLAANRQTVANIVGHYAKEIGVDFQRKEQGDIGKGYVGVKDKGDKHAIAFASGKDIYVNINGFELPKGLDNINFLKNVLVHKNGHKKDFIANEPRSYLLHAKVYLNQITDPSFDKVPKEQQLGTLGSFANHLLNYYANEELNGFGPGIEKLIDEFNNKNPAGY
ncbi:hypothetical protein [uncultured Chitinophaga sp.]|jgi:hypothetical protein|uniref:hypothetical protein n=1 Tax=uncultured Chitinophaga sp. TaxID=339340 RepID=UPI002604CA3C|nr:hypothetical protein [uncultured Chitinophaga sp.]